MMSTTLCAWRSSRGLLAIGLLALPVFGLCMNDTVPVSIHAVNYSSDDFTYIVEDPLDRKNTGGGESVGPYEAGGIMCCYNLPQSWRSGIQVKVLVTHRARLSADESGPEVAETKIVEVPPYIDGKVGELWVVRAADGSLSVLSSDYQPDHIKWPGVVKGWPVPSLAYRRQLWAQHLKVAQGGLNTAEKALRELQVDPDRLAKQAWELDQKYNKATLTRYSGPADAMYIAHVRQEFELMKRSSEEKVRQLKERQP